jgi:hypothetical protein
VLGGDDPATIRFSKHKHKRAALGDTGAIVANGALKAGRRHGGIATQRLNAQVRDDHTNLGRILESILVLGLNLTPTLMRPALVDRNDIEVVSEELAQSVDRVNFIRLSILLDSALYRSGHVLGYGLRNRWFGDRSLCGAAPASTDKRQ